MLSTPPDKFILHAERDMANPHLLDEEGRAYTFDEMMEKQPASMMDEITQEKWDERYAATQRGINRVSEVLREANADALVIVGDDQEEFFFEDNRPSIAVFHGDALTMHAHDFSRLPPSFRVAAWGWYSETEEHYPVQTDLSRHLIEELMEDDFDIASMSKQPEGYSVGHAFSFVERRIMQDHRIPIVPIMLNTYFPPNQPSSARCIELGRSIRRAVESWDRDKRVVIMASGGLSHFVVLEGLDRAVLKAFETRDYDFLANIPEQQLQSGTSEIKNWITVAGAMHDRSFELIEYVPLYRSPAGTGGGWSWGLWN
jgi:aromatic ring-opening dioxygenase catalytic subunit (LigB family)